jgi:hypothetical protein
MISAHLPLNFSSFDAVPIFENHRTMTRFILAVLLFAAAIACSPEKDDQTDGNLPATEIKNPHGTEPVAGDAFPVISFDKTEHNFGNINLGEVVLYEFKVTNTGNTDLIIFNAQPSCGCTVSEFPKDPIKPGQSGVIPVEYNSKGRPGQFSKTITVFANTEPNQTVLTISGMVE